MNARSYTNAKITENCMALPLKSLIHRLGYLLAIECDVPSLISHHLCQVPGSGTYNVLQPPEVYNTTPSSRLSEVLYKHYILFICYSHAVCCI